MIPRITTEDKEKWRGEIDAYKRLLKRTHILSPSSRWEDEAVQRALSLDPAYRNLLERPDILRVYFGKYLVHLEKKMEEGVGKKETVPLARKRSPSPPPPQRHGNSNRRHYY